MDHAHRKSLDKDVMNVCRGQDEGVWLKCVNFAIDFTQDVCRELVLIGKREENLKGEIMDLQHGLRFVKDTSIRASTGNQL